jgi:hypothetical protein
MANSWRKVILGLVLVPVGLLLCGYLILFGVLYWHYRDREFAVDSVEAFQSLRPNIRVIPTLQLEQLSPLRYFRWAGSPTDGSEIWRFRPQTPETLNSIIAAYRLERFSPSGWKENFTIPWESFEDTKRPDWIVNLDRDTQDAYALDPSNCAENRPEKHCSLEMFLWRVSDSDWMLYSANW